MYVWGVIQLWGAVAQCLEHATDNRVVEGLNPTAAAWKLWQFRLPPLPVSFGVFLSGVYARGSKRSHTGG